MEISLWVCETSSYQQWKKPFEGAPTMNDRSPLDISFVDKLINLEWNPKIWLSNTLWYTNIAIENCHL
jgi:hypothetical protein